MAIGQASSSGEREKGACVDKARLSRIEQLISSFVAPIETCFDQA